NFRERAAGRFHLSENEIASAVQNSTHHLNVIGHKALAQALDDGNATGDSGLEFQRQTVLLRELGKRYAVMSEQRLIRGDEMFFFFKGGWGERASRTFFAADQFDDNIDIIARGKR